MKAAVLYGKNDIRVEETDIPELDAHEILVRVKAAGICGSDLPRVMGDAAHHVPIVLGHEFAGVVERIGSEVTKVKVGERIAGVPLMPCHQCENCRAGHYAQCKFYSFIGSRINGAWAEYVKMPEQNALPIGEDISFEEAALIEPSSVALHALQIVGFQGGEEHVAILGGGNIGLLTLQWAKLLGAKNVTVFDIDEERLQTAKRLGADFSVHCAKAEFRSEWLEITEGGGYGIVMETAGAAATMRLSFELSAVKSKICFVGTPTHDLTFTPKLFEQLNRKEFTLTGSWMSYSAPFPGNEWALSLRFLQEGRLNFRDVVFKKYRLEQINEAFALYRRPGAVKGKILLCC